MIFFNLFMLSLFTLFLPLSSYASIHRVASYAELSYDVVYVRCPRAREPAVINGVEFFNWNGVNDIWLSASNNIYHQPGCDLVLHHSSPEFSMDGIRLAAGDRAREEVLVNCDEEDASVPVCSIADPNVSFDGKKIVYAKFTDTRSFIDKIGMNGDGGKLEGTDHSQSIVKKLENGVITRGGNGAGTYSSPVLIFEYDLETKTERQISPAPKHFSGRAHPGLNIEWQSNIPAMDTGPFYMHDGRIGFTSNRESGFYKFQLFVMDSDGENLELLGHRALTQQLHPFVLMDGRIAYTSLDTMLNKSSNNEFSLFTINPDGSFPFILAGKQDSTMFSYHFATQLSDGDVVVAQYYNRNNGGMGTLLRFPIDPPGPDFKHLGFNEDAQWQMGNSMIPFARVNEFILTPEAGRGDDAQRKYSNPSDYWTHPSRTGAGKPISNGSEIAYTDNALIQMTGRFTHPAAAPENDLLVAYTIGASSSMGSYSGSLQEQLDVIGKDAGIWHLPLGSNNESDGSRKVGHIVDDGKIVVDFPEYHEIMSRALVPYSKIYSITKPGINLNSGSATTFIKRTINSGDDDPRLKIGEPFGLTGAATLYDRETRSLNGTPWNALDGGGKSSGRNYSNLNTNGAELAIFDNDEVFGIRVLMPISPFQNGYSGGIEKWIGQNHHTRILGEFPVRKFNPDNTQPLDAQGNPDTSFVLKIPANTPFLFQTLDKRGMALDIETTSRTVVAGEQQFCGGCHVHTRESIDPFSSLAKLDTAGPLGDFSGDSAPLLTNTTDGAVITTSAADIYSETLVPGIDKRKSFAVDWENGISQVIEKRCSGCHEEGAPAQVLTGLRLDGDIRTYLLLATNQYTREDGVKFNHDTLPGDGLHDVTANTIGTDRITKPYSCCRSSRWISRLSARSSMLVWAMYGERLDGRNPETGMPWGSQGEEVPDTVPASMQNLPVDDQGLEHPEVWPKVSEHLSYLNGTSAMPGTTVMPEHEKRLIARWIDIGAPRLNVHDDMIRPVLTVTPVLEGESISRVLLGVWDDSPLDYSRFEVRNNGVVIMSGEDVVGAPNVIEVALSTPVTQQNADAVKYTFEIWDKPDRFLSLVSPGTPAANRERKVITGRGLFRLVDANPNSAPTAVTATIEAEQSVPLSFFPAVDDPDTGNSHFFEILSQPSHGVASVENNRVVYVSEEDYLGADNFMIRASDLGGLAVDGLVTVDVVPKKLGPSQNPDTENKAPTSTSAIAETLVNTTVLLVPRVEDIDDEVHVFQLLSEPSNGIVRLLNNVFEYTPNQDYSGPDSFNFRATDSGGLSASGVANILVSKPELTSNPPTSAFANVVTQMNNELTFAPTIKDPDIDDLHTLEVVSRARFGDVEVVDNQFLYSPDEEFVGVDSFVFRATDRSGFSVNGYANIVVYSDSSNLAMFSATAVFVTIKNQLQVVAPIVEGQTDSLSYSYSILTTPANGTAAVQADKLIFTPNEDYVGTDSFLFEVLDSEGRAILGVARIEVKETVIGDHLNKSPVDASAELIGQSNKEIVVTPFVDDPDEDETFTFKIYEAPNNGTAYIKNNQLAYVSANNFIGEDSFTFIVTDSAGNKVIGLAVVSVQEGNKNDSSVSFSGIGYFPPLILLVLLLSFRIKRAIFPVGTQRMY